MRGLWANFNSGLTKKWQSKSVNRKFLLPLRSVKNGTLPEEAP